MTKKPLVGVVAMALALALAGVLAPGPVRAGEPGSGRHDASAAARAQAAFIKYMSSHRPMVRSNALPLVTSAGATEIATFNWSGFADVESGTKRVSSVSGQWVIPYVECPIGNYRYQDTIISQWVGIDGFSDGTVEQLGSAAWCFEGVTYYYVWYEMFPAGTVVEGTAECINNNVDCPQPGDLISASVSATPSGNYTLSLTDFNRPQEGFSVTASCAPTTCLDSSGEWIVERAAFELPFGPQFISLVDFFQTGFLSGALTSGGKSTKIEGFQDGTVYDIAMIDDSESYFLDCVGQQGLGPRLLVLPDGCPTVAPSGGSFTVGWDSSY
jgi:hypothetical protein